MARKKPTIDPDDSHVAADVKRSGQIAGFLLVILVILSFFLD